MAYLIEDNKEDSVEAIYIIAWLMVPVRLKSLDWPLLAAVHDGSWCTMGASARWELVHRGSWCLMGDSARWELVHDGS